MATTLSEVYRDHPIHMRHIIPLDFSSLSTLPDSHAWPQPHHHDHDDNSSSSSSSIPIIDLMDPNAMGLIGQACEDFGAFQLRNHGVPLGVIEEAEKEAERLFNLPSEQKLKALRTPGAATGYGRARISQFFSKYMWHEGFTIMGSPSSDVKKIWPNDYSRFCDKMENYQQHMKSLAEQLTRIMFQLLGLPSVGNNWAGSNGAVQLNFYPSCPEPKKAMGLAPHTDTSLFTILHQAQQAHGLQILKEGIGWVPVNPHQNALVVHTGDFLHIMSNARFRSALHRVVVSRTRQRYSVAYFHNPPLDYVLSGGARFRDVSVKEYIGIKAKNFREALSLISI